MKGRGGGDIAIGVPTLAAHAFGAGLVDDVHLFISPVLVGVRRVDNGVVHLHRRVRG